MQVPKAITDRMAAIQQDIEIAEMSVRVNRDQLNRSVGYLNQLKAEQRHLVMASEALTNA